MHQATPHDHDQSDKKKPVIAAVMICTSKIEDKNQLQIVTSQM